MLHQRQQGDGFHEAMARFKSAPSSSYIVVAWDQGTKLAHASSLARINSVSTSRPGQNKTTHTVFSEGELVNFDLQPMKRYLGKGLAFHVLLKVKDDIVMIQQIGGVGTGGMERKRALSAANSISTLVSNITFTITVTHPNQLTRALLQSKVGYNLPAIAPTQRISNGSSSSDISVKTIDEHSAANVPICISGETNSPVLDFHLGKDSSGWTRSGSPAKFKGKALLPILLDSKRSNKSSNKRLSITSLYETADSVFQECSSSIESMHDYKGQGTSKPTTILQDAFNESSKTATATSFPLKQINTNNIKLLPPLVMSAPPSKSHFTTSIHPQSNSWTLDKESKGRLSPQRQQNLSPVMTPREKERLRRKADETKREQVLKRLTEEQNSWDDGIPSYYQGDCDDAGERRGPSVVAASSLLQQRGGHKKTIRLPPIAPPPLGPLPASPGPSSGSILRGQSTTTPGRKFSSPLAHTVTSKSVSSPRVGQTHLVARDDCLSPLITLGGHVKRPFRSNSVVSKRHSNKEREEDLQLQEMQPLMASIEIARRNTKKMQSSDLEGESWLTRVQRQRAQSDAMSMGMPSTPGLLLSGRETLAANSMEALQARQRALYFQLSEAQRKQRDLEESEKLSRIKWVGDEVYRRSLNAFDRSTREAEEKRRKETFDQAQRENVIKMEGLQKQLREVKEMMEDGVNYRNKLERAQKERHARFTSEERLRQDWQLQGQMKNKVNAERRADLQVELQANHTPLMARGSFSVQSDGGIKRKRRRYELHRDCLLLYSDRIRSIGGTAEAPLAKITIEPGCIVSIRDAFEDLQAPHSFCLQYLNKKEGTHFELLACTDTEEEKERLLIGLALLSCYKLKDSTFE